MSLQAETPRNGRTIEHVNLPEYSGNVFRFEGVNIQMDKGQWTFGGADNAHSLDTYSIWSPLHHEEIAERLKKGDRAASYIMGNFGVVEIRRPEVKEYDAMYETIKKRSRSQNFVAFVNPDDVIDIVDIDRLPKELKHLRWAGARNALYPGPMHAVLPIKKNAEVDPGVIRQQDNTLAAFWIPGHWGYEALGDKLRKKVKRGLLGGGSLNVHGDDPSYTTKELFTAFNNHPEWQEEIDFIIFDEIAEAAKIGRSQTMISFASYPPEILRVGSLSPDKIEMHLGMPLHFEPERMTTDKKYTASSKTRYSKRNNEISDRKIVEVMAQMARFDGYYNGKLRGDHKVAATFHRRAHHPAI